MECQAAPMAPRNQGMPVGAVGCHFVHGPLNPAASAFYPVVSGPPACNPQPGCLDSPPGLPRFGVDNLGSMPSRSGVTMVGYPNLARPLRMPYLGVAHGCACAAFLAVCVVPLAYYSVLVTRTTCVKSTKSRDTVLNTGIR